MAVKICSNCNEQFDEAAVVCKYCGQPTERVEDGNSSAVLENNSRKTSLYIGIAIIAAVVIIAVWMMYEM